MALCRCDFGGMYASSRGALGTESSTESFRGGVGLLAYGERTALTRSPRTVTLAVEESSLLPQAGCPDVGKEQRAC